jgi:hypothetical protein
LLRAPRALTADIIRVPFIQDTINLIRRSHQTYFDFSAFIDGKVNKKKEFFENNFAIFKITIKSNMIIFKMMVHLYHQVLIQHYLLFFVNVFVRKPMKINHNYFLIQMKIIMRIHKYY